MSPTECTDLVVRTKQPGLELEARESVLSAPYANERDADAEASAYEGLLLDVLEGDHTPFLRFDEVEWSWRIIDPILKAWQVGAPEDYVAGSDGPTGQHRFLGPGHAWRPLSRVRRLIPATATLSRGRLRLAVAAELAAHRRRAPGRRTRPRRVTRTGRTAPPRSAEPARPRRRRPRPSSGPRPSRSLGLGTRASSGDACSDAAVRSSSHDAMTLPRRHTSLTAARSISYRYSSGSRSGAVSASNSAVPCSPALAWCSMLSPSAYARHHAYSMPLCTIFTKWPAPGGPQWR